MESEVKQNSETICTTPPNSNGETIITIEPDAPTTGNTVLSPPEELNVQISNEHAGKLVREEKNPDAKSVKLGTPLLLSPNTCGVTIGNVGGSASSIDRQYQEGQQRHKPCEKPRSTHASYSALPLLESGKPSLSKLLSGSGSCIVSSGGTPSDEKLDVKMADGKMVTPRRHPRSNIKGLPLESSSLKLNRNPRQPLALSSALKAGPKERPCEQHCFLTDVADVRQMEQGLLQLLDDFHSGKLQAFGQDCTVEKMEQVREQQERLARLHFDLNSGQEIVGPQTNEGRQMAKENLPKLIESLHQLSLSIEQLQSTSPGVQTQV